MRRLFPPEGFTFKDRATGRSVRQVTSANAVHHQPFFLAPAYDDAQQHLVFVSHRTGRPEVYVEERESRTLVQLTDQPGLNEWSMHPSRDGRYIYYTAASGGYRVEVSTGEVETLIDFGRSALRGDGMVAAGMGTTALSACGRWWAVATRDGDRTDIVIVDTERGTSGPILRRDTVAHMQFCPDDSALLFYAGPFKERIWTVNRDGTGNRSLYQRERGQWITHESWIPGTGELAFVDWPHGVFAIHVDTGEVRVLASFSAWHPRANRNGTLMVADTNFPDIGLQAFRIDDAPSTPQLLCESLSSNQGEHWAGSFPYEEGPIRVIAPQHTHPHPTFSPDDRHVVFSSDRTGTTQVYEVEVGSIA